MRGGVGMRVVGMGAEATGAVGIEGTASTHGEAHGSPLGSGHCGRPIGGLMLMRTRR
jgi:hypothetical protein